MRSSCWSSQILTAPRLPVFCSSSVPLSPPISASTLSACIIFSCGTFIHNLCLFHPLHFLLLALPLLPPSYPDPAQVTIHRVIWLHSLVNHLQEVCITFTKMKYVPSTWDSSCKRFYVFIHGPIELYRFIPDIVEKHVFVIVSRSIFDLCTEGTRSNQ